MSEDTNTTAPDESAESAPAETTEQESAEVVAGADALGDAGKRALDAMKAERNEWKSKFRETSKALDEMRAELERMKNGGEDATAKAIREAEAAALARANERIIKAELRAAASGKLADPNDVYRFLDLSAFEVDADGNVDTEAIGDAIDDLIKSKPYLGAATAKRFQGTADGGARNGPKKPSQLSRGDLRGMTPEQIQEARKSGRLDDLLNKR